MIWFAIFASILVGSVFGLVTRDLRRALRAALITLVIGVALALVIVYSGLMGG